MIILDVQQGSPEWFAARAGRPTASEFSKIITTTGAPSKQADKYMLRLAGERIIGKSEETYTSAAMQRGKDVEAEAREVFEFINDVEVQQVGLIYKDESKTVACSPDGLFDDVGLEIKCPSLAVHVGYLLAGKLPTEYYCQVQGSMYVTGLDNWWFFSYYPGIKPLQILVKREPMFMGKLHKAITEFNEKLEATYNKLRGKA